VFLLSSKQKSELKYQFSGSIACLFSLLKFFDELFDVINDDAFFDVIKDSSFWVQCGAL
jgi:hypothetical protein